MGTLGNQRERNQYQSDKYLDAFLKDANDLAKANKTTIDVVVQAKIALEMERQNNIAVQDGDYTDEQAGGFGEILNKIANSLEALAEK